jgi:hypothetical protein
MNGGNLSSGTPLFDLLNNMQAHAEKYIRQGFINTANVAFREN